MHSLLCAGSGAAQVGSEQGVSESSALQGSAVPGLGAQGSQQLCSTSLLHPEKRNQQPAELPGSPLGLSLPLPQLSSLNRGAKYCTNKIRF